MIIGNSNIFTGAYNERIYSQNNQTLQISKEKEFEILNGIKEASKTLNIDRSDKTSISQEAKDFLCSDAAREKMQADLIDLYNKSGVELKQIALENPEDKFWVNTGNQWLTLSEELYNNGFYDNMSDEDVKEVEDILAKITAGMDSLSRTMYNTGIDYNKYVSGRSYFMDSSEAILELESAKSALKYFCKTKVDESLKESFNDLIDNFYSHNSKLISEYKSPMESFNKVVNTMNNGKVDSKNTKEYNLQIQAGGVTHDVKEKQDFSKVLSELFINLMTEQDNASIWGQIEKLYVNYNTAGTDSKELENYEKEKCQAIIDRLKDYWEELV